MDDGQPNASASPPRRVAAVSSSLRGAHRFAAVRLDNVGDVVMLGPALRALRRHLPHAHLTLLASPAGSHAAPLLPWVDAVMVERVVWQDADARLALDPGRELALVARIAEGGFDAALIFTSFSQSPWPPAYACYLAGVPRRAGQATDFGGSLLTDVVPPLPGESHQVDRNLHLVEALGVPLAGRHLEIAVPAGADERAVLLLAEAGVAPGEPFVALAPGASCPARRYPPERFSSVAVALADAGWPVVVLGSAGEADLAAQVLAGAGDRRIVSIVGRTDVPELAAVLGRASLVVANDSGPMHLADALGRPTVVLFAGTDLESQWRPRGAPSRLLRRPTTCSPCYGFTCPYDLACLDIAPEEVVAHALDLLGEHGAGPAATRPGGVCVRSAS